MIKIHNHGLILLIILMTFKLQPGLTQVDAGEDITISAGLPVSLNGIYEGLFGIPVSAQDDYFVGPFQIGFSFSYFEENFTLFAIGPNGLLSFEVPDIIGFSHWDPATIPTPEYPKTIMGPYQDLFSRPVAEHSQYIYYATTGSEPNRKLIVGWCEAPMYSCEDEKATFQIVLNESDSSIMNHIIAKPACETNVGNRATQGLNFDDNTGIAVDQRNSTSWTAFGETWIYRQDNYGSYEIEQIDFQPEVIVPQGKLDWAWYKDSPGGELISSSRSTVVHPMESTRYYVEITCCGGVKYVDDIYVKVIPVPNAFNPNSQVEKNREFKFFTDNTDLVSNFRMYIYNRWGQQVFETFDMTEGWNGESSGKPCNPGVYVWIVYFRGPDGEEVANKGTVTLLR
ncbi:MAG: gliding motility-associated C-terminal domain-containing protein [Bacteroidales bacterium]|nr:gliding motility-associated C-terminal domain-containing protein [Bacteroidales bacterium]